MRHAKRGRLRMRKWIFARDLEAWADTYDARTKLSELVNRLVRASVQDINSFRFPTGDSAAIPGYDGRLECVGCPPHVPEGYSVWEFGTDADFLKKANKDFDKRSRDPGAVVCANTTFVFVTPRTWNSKTTLSDWEAKKRDGTWKDVKAVDAVQLEDWLEQCPQVAAWAARFLLMKQPPTGTRSADEFWDEYASGFKPPLNGPALLCGRGDQAKRLVEQLGGAQQQLFYAADSPDEVVAFTIAAVREADSGVRKFLEARMLILDSEEAARFFAYSEHAIFVARGTAGRLAGLLGNRNLTLVPFGRETQNRPTTITLERPPSFLLTEALVKMGVDQQRSEQLARECGRSVTILARRIPSGTVEPPEWYRSQELVPALLAGGWDANREDDQRAVADLAGVSNYAEFEDGLLPFLRMPEP